MARASKNYDVSVALSIFSVMACIIISYATNLAPAEVIMLVSIAAFLVVLAAKYSTNKHIIIKLEEARS